MNKVLHNIWISLIITSLLCLACDKEDPIKTEDSPVVNNDTLKVEVITSDAIGIQPKSATLAALCSVSDADNLQGVACFYYDTIAGSVENLKLNGRKIDSDSITANSNSFYATIKDLKPETQYHFAASITIGGKEYYGSVKTFTTMPIDTRPLILYQHDGTVRYVSNSAVDSITDNGAIKSFYINGSLVAAYSINMLDSIAYQYPSGVTIQPFPNVSDFITAIDNAVAPTPTNITEPSAPDDEDANDYSDYIENYTVKNTLTFTWNDNSVTVSGTVPSGVTITKNNGHVTVKSTKGKMKYRLKGASADGSFKIEDMNTTQTDDNNKKFILELNGVDLTNPNGAAINIQSGKTVLVNIPINTVNTLKDGATYTQTNQESQKGTFFSEGQLIFSGPGTLNVTSLGGHGICSDDYIRLRYNVGQINITSAKDGFNTKDRFLMYGGTVKVNSLNDGVSVRRGPFELYGGSLDITSTDDGIVSADSTMSLVKIGGGNLIIATTGPKGHAITTNGKLLVEQGTVTASTQGAASKCFTASGEIVINGSYINLSTQGNPQYDEEDNNWSSAACIRPKSSLTISDSKLFLSSSGLGSKCINGAAGVNIETSQLTLASQGTDYVGDGNIVRSRAVDAVSLTVNDGTDLCISAALTAIYTESKFDITGGNIFAFTLSSDIKAINLKGTISQTGGLLMSGFYK